MHRTIPIADPGLFDYAGHVDRLKQRKTPLDRLNDIVAWERFRPILSSAFARSGPDVGGRPAFDGVFMFKILVLQRIHGLSEEATELAVMDRLTWQRFLGIHVGCAFPDKNTIWDFKQALIEAKAMDRCFEAFFAQIAAHGVRLKSGLIVDATIVEVPVQHNTSAENAVIKAGGVPAAWKKPGQEAKLRQKDTDARWTAKREAWYFGYKNHVAVDQKTKLIRRYAVTDAAVHDSQVLMDLVKAGDGRLYADSAYQNRSLRGRLRRLGVPGWIIEPARRNHPLSEEQQRRNRTKSRIRVRVEHVFGIMTTSLSGVAQRCIGMRRNAQLIAFGNLVYNMHRLRFMTSTA